MLLVVVVAMLGVRERFRITLLEEVDATLADDTLEVALAVEQFYPNLQQAYNEMERKRIGHDDREMFIELLDADGKMLYLSSNAPAGLVDALRPPRHSKSKMTTVGKYRVAQRRLEKPDFPLYIVRIGLSLDPIDADVAKLTNMMILAILATLCVAPLGGYWLAGRATHPLARIIATTARLRPSHMEERLPIRGAADELDQLSATINGFLDRIADYLSRNREFVANAAHELRSPLAAIQSSVEVTLHSERSIDQYQELLDDIAAQCGQLGGLVNQLLLLAETDIAGFQIQRKPVAIDRLVARSVDMFRGAAEERGIQFTSRSSGVVIVPADGDRLRQVLNNLIDNSLKFTPRGGRVQVSLGVDPATKQMILDVEDTGGGIAAEDLPHVFERFYRGDKSRGRGEQIQGNGLGLSICQAIVAAHNGSITVESTLGQGAALYGSPAARIAAARRAGSCNAIDASRDQRRMIAAPLAFRAEALTTQA